MLDLITTQNEKIIELEKPKSDTKISIKNNEHDPAFPEKSNANDELDSLVRHESNSAYESESLLLFDGNNTTSVGNRIDELKRELLCKENCDDNEHSHAVKLLEVCKSALS